MLGTQNSALIIELTVNAPFMTDTTHASGKIRKVICGVVIGPFPELVNLKSADMDHSGAPLNRCQLKTGTHAWRAPGSTCSESGCQGRGDKEPICEPGHCQWNTVENIH